MHLSRRRSEKRPRSGRPRADLARAARFGKARRVPSFCKVEWPDLVVSTRSLVTRTCMMLFYVVRGKSFARVRARPARWILTKLGVVVCQGGGSHQKCRRPNLATFL